LPVEESSGSLGGSNRESVIFEQAPKSGELMLVVMRDSESCKCGDVINSVMDLLTGFKIAKALVCVCLEGSGRSSRRSISSRSTSGIDAIVLVASVLFVPGSGVTLLGKSWRNGSLWSIAVEPPAPSVLCPPRLSVVGCSSLTVISSHRISGV
jgi:hypothetical protein